MRTAPGSTGQGPSPARTPTAPTPAQVADRLFELLDRVSPSYLVLAGVALVAGIAASIVFGGEETETSSFRALMMFNAATLASLGMIALSMLAPRQLAAEYGRLAGLFALGLVYVASIVFDVMYIMFTLVFGFFGGDVTYLDSVPGWPR